MASARETREIEQAAEAVGDLLVTAVQATIEHRTPDAARAAVAELVGVDEKAAPDTSGGPAQLMAMLTLVRWLGLIRDAQADRPQRVQEALDRVGELLGNRYRSRARYVAGTLQGEDGAEEARGAQVALRGEFLPAMVWLVAGAVAEFGDGDTGWLRGLESGAPPVAALLS